MVVNGMMVLNTAQIKKLQLVQLEGGNIFLNGQRVDNGVMNILIKSIG